MDLMLYLHSVLEEYAGFRSGRGCIDKIFIIRQLMEKYLEKNNKMYAPFINMENVYDNVWRADLCATLE